MQQRRMIAIALAFVAAAGLIAASLGKRWLTTSDDSSGIGLRQVEVCNTTCETVSLSAAIDEIDRDIARTKESNRLLPPNQQVVLPKPPWHGFPVMGMCAFIASLLAAAGLLAAAVLALARKRLALPILPTTVAVLGMAVALISGCSFVATKPAAIVAMGVGWTFGVFGGGIVLGLAAVFPLNRQIRPIDEELGEGSATMSWGASRDD